MTNYWWCCTKCDDIGKYQIIDDWNDFPRGEFMVHQDFITTGFKSEQDARAYLDKEQGRPPAEWHHYFVKYRFDNGSGSRRVLATSEQNAIERVKDSFTMQRFSPRNVTIESIMVDDAATGSAAGSVAT